jgi:hypothetical protein
MSDTKRESEAPTKAFRDTQKKSPLKDLPNWEAPKLEDVSEQVMAQPYIRFT